MVTSGVAIGVGCRLVMLAEIDVGCRLVAGAALGSREGGGCTLVILLDFAGACSLGGICWIWGIF